MHFSHLDYTVPEGAAEKWTLVDAALFFESGGHLSSGRSPARRRAKETVDWAVERSRTRARERAEAVRTEKAERRKRELRAWELGDARALDAIEAGLAKCQVGDARRQENDVEAVIAAAESRETVRGRPPAPGNSFAAFCRARRGPEEDQDAAEADDAVGATLAAAAACDVVAIVPVCAPLAPPPVQRPAEVVAGIDPAVVVLTCQPEPGLDPKQLLKQKTAAASPFAKLGWRPDPTALALRPTEATIRDQAGIVLRRRMLLAQLAARPAGQRPPPQFNASPLLDGEDHIPITFVYSSQVLRTAAVPTEQPGSESAAAAEEVSPLAATLDAAESASVEDSKSKVLVVRRLEERLVKVAVSLSRSRLRSSSSGDALVDSLWRPPSGAFPARAPAPLIAVHRQLTPPPPTQPTSPSSSRRPSCRTRRPAPTPTDAWARPRGSRSCAFPSSPARAASRTSRE